MYWPDKFSRLARASPVRLWVLAFLILNLLALESGGVVSMSRYAALRAMTDQHTFRIDDFVDWTVDWARTPDGHYYSNKAPGAVFLAFPLFWALDQACRLLPRCDQLDERGRRRPPGFMVQTMISVSYQAIPFGLLCLLAVAVLNRNGATTAAMHFCALALLFGNTAAIFMSSWFGHGITSCLVLSACLCLVYGRYFLLGLSIGLAVLCDYSAALLVPGFVCALVCAHRANLFWIGPFLLGGAMPGVLWWWYHDSAFGSPFAIANQFQNPAFVYVADVPGNVWGIFAPVPSAHLLFELLLGSTRGLLFTQPWVLVLLPASLILATRSSGALVERQLTLVCLIGFALLLWMNASFGGWHGGLSAGPRYLSAILPPFALLAGLQYRRLSFLVRALLWITLFVAVGERGQIFATTILAPREPLWAWQWQVLTSDDSLREWARLGTYWIVLMTAGWRLRERKTIT